MSFSTLRIRPAALAALTLAVTIPVVTLVALKVNSQENGSNGSLGLQGKNQGKSEGSDDHNLPLGNITVVPEANAGWVMVPFFGAVLLMSSRQFLRARANQKKAS